jgi:pyruvate formate lyase activating enzyme
MMWVAWLFGRTLVDLLPEWFWPSCLPTAADQSTLCTGDIPVALFASHYRLKFIRMNMSKEADMVTTSLGKILDELTVEGELYEKLANGAVRCFACGHRCLIREGRRGICQVRFNEGGKLYVPHGYVAALQADPIEKKPFFHVLPGSNALTFGMLGCDFHCSYCQNWLSSQAMRDPQSDMSVGFVRRVTAEQIVAYAMRTGAEVIASSYNEPLITTEWAMEIFRPAQEAGLKCVYISNGNITPEVLATIRPYMVGYKIDLKTMQDKHYRKMGGVLENVLEGIRSVHESGLWVEVVTLVVPDFNDSTDELMDTARFIASVSADIPWHVTAFHPDYKMTAPRPTSVNTLLRAAEIGQEAGLNYVYAGNLPGRLHTYENTYCPKCKALLIERTGYVIYNYHLTAQGTCPKCATQIPGVWSDRPDAVQLHGWGIPKHVGS